jgi:hypothetical protein
VVLNKSAVAFKEHFCRRMAVPPENWSRRQCKRCRANSSCRGGIGACTVAAGERRCKGLLDQHGNRIDNHLHLSIPDADLGDIKMDQVRLITPLPLIKEAIIALPVAKRQEPWSDQVLMTKGVQATMAGCRQTFGEEQGGHGAETGIGAAIHPRVGMATVKEQGSLRQGFARPIEALLDKDAGLRGQKTIPSRSTCWTNDIARYRGESHVRRLEACR